MSAIAVMSGEELVKAASLSSKKIKTIDWRGRPLTIKEQISLQEYLGVVQHILNDCSRDNSVAYELVDFVTRVNIIGSFAFIDLPKDAHKLYEIVYNTDLYTTILANVQSWQVAKILEAVYLYTGIRGGAV